MSTSPISNDKFTPASPAQVEPAAVKMPNAEAEIEATTIEATCEEIDASIDALFEDDVSEHEIPAPPSPVKVQPVAVKIPNVQATASEHTSEEVGQSINALFKDELPKDGTSPPALKRKRSTSVISFSSASVDDEPAEKPPPNKQQKTSKEADYIIKGQNDPRPRSKPHPSLLKMMRNMPKEQRPRPARSGPVAQKISIGTKTADTWDPFKYRKLTEDATKQEMTTTLAKKRPEIAAMASTTRFRTWKDEKDGKITWKVFPKSTPRIKHRGGMVVVETLLQDPAGHPDITIREYEEDQTCWIARVEELTAEAIATRRAELTAAAKAARKQGGRGGGAAPRKRTKTSK